MNENPRQRRTPEEPWFAVRRELSSRRASFLTVCSFALPLLIWAAVSYLPFVWHPDIRLQVSADRENATTVYTAGDRLSKGFYPQFQEAVRQQNARLEASLAAGLPADPTKSASIRRANKKILRHLVPCLVRNGWFSEEQAKDDALIYRSWGELATGARGLSYPKLSQENLEIVRKNWAAMSAVSTTYDPATFISRPLLSLIPQGVPSNPDYLPAPHQVIRTGWKDLTSPAVAGRPSMIQRIGHSIQIVFGGFLLAALIGVPLGVVCGTYDFFAKIFEPFTDFFRYMPAPTFSALLVAIFLANDAPKIALVFIGTFFQLVLVVANTTRQLDAPLLEAAQTLGARQFQLLTSVVVPGILPNLYNDLRILLGWAWTWLVIAELIGVKSGLTEFIETQGRYRNFDSVFPIIILIGLIGFGTDQILAYLRGLIFPWTPGGKPLSQSRLVKAILWLPRWVRCSVIERHPEVPSKIHVSKP